MDLADKPCYPITYESFIDPNQTNQTHYNFTEGLTFRERLIIAGMSNSMLIENAWDDDGMPTTNTDQGALERNAKSIINQADAIINQLTKE